jgi:positive phototaxis protein PixI
LNLADRQAHQFSSVVESSSQTQQQFLRFLLPPGLTVLIEIDRVTELISIPIDRVVPMPHLPPAVKGVYNWRGEILWIVDLAILLGVAASPHYRSLQPTMIISNAVTSEVGGADAFDRRQAQTIGFIVDEIAEIEWYELDLIRPVPDWIQPELSMWMRGLWESNTGEKFLVLDGQAIFDRADIHADL